MYIGKRVLYRGLVIAAERDWKYTPPVTPKFVFHFIPVSILITRELSYGVD